MGWDLRVKIIAIIVTIALIISLIATYIISLSGHRVKAFSIGLGVEFNTHASPVWVALHEDLFKKYNINVTKVLKFRTGLELAAALARGDVKAGWACLGPLLMIISKGIPIKIVAKIHNHGYAIVVNPRYVRSIQDLSKVDVYTPGKGSPAYLLLLKVMDTYRLKPKSIKFKPPTTILTGLLSGKILAAAIPEHYVSIAEAKGLKVLIRSQDIWPDMPGSFLAVHVDIIKKHPNIVRKLIKVTLEGLKYIKERPNYVAKIDSKVLGIDIAIAKRSLSMLNWNTTIDPKKIQEYIDFMYRHGILHKKLNALDIIAKI